jgi:hypothetical protein
MTGLIHLCSVCWLQHILIIWAAASGRMMRSPLRRRERPRSSARRGHRQSWAMCLEAFQLGDRYGVLRRGASTASCVVYTRVMAREEIGRGSREEQHNQIGEAGNNCISGRIMSLLQNDWCSIPAWTSACNYAGLHLNLQVNGWKLWRHRSRFDSQGKQIFGPELKKSIRVWPKSSSHRLRCRYVKVE